MANFNKKIFGSDIDIKTKKKLMVRQALSENANPNESMQSLVIDGKVMNLNEIAGIGTHNFNKDGLYLADLSSRTPWARAWVAVELYYHSPEVLGKEKNIANVVEEFLGAPRGGAYIKKKTTYTTEREVISAEENYSFEKKVYVLGDNNYDLFKTKENIHDPIMGKDSSKSMIKGSIDLNKQFPNEMQNNPLMKPASGITSIESKTEGFAGAIKRTTVNFTVHNFDDYQNIYARYFLKPGATIVVDFGWDVTDAYKPDNIVEDIREGIYGTGKILDNAAGDLDVIIGKVVDFTSTVDENGSFICSMTLISDNASIIDYEISDKNKLKNKLVDELPVTVINKVANMLGRDFLKQDWNSSSGNRQESEWYANSWANNLFSSGENGKGSVSIGSYSSKVGLYWQSLGMERIKTDDRNDIPIPLLRGITGTFSDIAISDDNNIFISWAFFEEEVLNKNLGFEGGNDSFYGGHFNSVDSFVSYESNLLSRQNVGSSFGRSKTGFKFLYPPSWNDGDTYDTINHKDKTDLRQRPEKSTDISNIGEMRQQILKDDATNILNLARAIESNFETSLDKAANRIPLREIFINLSVIRDAFSNNDNVSEAMLEILDVLNGDSQNVFNLKLVSGTRDNSTMTVVDTNYYNSKNDELVGDKFSNLFKFKPYSKGSIVKEMSLTYQTPNNSLQTMIAIQNRSMNIPLFPSTDIQDENQAMRIIYGSIEGQYGIRYLPQPEVSGKNNEEQESLDSFGPTPDRIYDAKIPADSIISDYASIVNDTVEFEQDNPLFDGLGDNYSIGDEKKEEPPMEGDNTPKDIVYPEALYANDLEEYYEYRCRTNFVHKVISPTIPVELTLTTYGNSGITPGNIFNIDYLPIQYKDRTFFQVMNVEHSVDSSGWKTTLQTQMRVRQEQISSEYFKTPQIYLSSTSTLLINKLHPNVRKFFKDFIVDDRTTGLVLVCKVRGRILNQKYNVAETMRGKYGPANYNNWLNTLTPEQRPSDNVFVELDREYTLLIGSGGAIAVSNYVQPPFLTGDTISIETLIKNFEKFIRDPNVMETTPVGTYSAIQFD